MAYTILLLEDDSDLGETLLSLLTMEGYDVTWVTRGDDAVDRTYENDYDLYVFDIGVPDIDGLSLLEALREASDETPALFISARTDLESIAHGFAAGAYDYIKKPFYPEELLIRIKARLGDMARKVPCGGSITYDPKEGLFYKDDTPLSLGEVQRCLLALLCQRRGDVVTKEQLYDCLQHPSDAALRVAINKLKQTTGLSVHNLRGVGYSLEKG
jgi:DNA-binding response OmpR family regulator